MVTEPAFGSRVRSHVTRASWGTFGRQIRRIRASAGCSGGFHEPLQPLALSRQSAVMALRSVSAAPANLGIRDWRTRPGFGQTVVPWIAEHPVRENGSTPGETYELASASPAQRGRGPDRRT
jgi:hypothetical protein